MEKLIIVRSQWLRGDSENSMLRNGDGKMCCLGFLCLERGYRAEEILDVPDPVTLIEENGRAKTADDFPRLKGLLEDNAQAIALHVRHSRIAADLMTWNDEKPSVRFPEHERERRIKEGMETIGIDVVFVD